MHLLVLLTFPPSLTNQYCCTTQFVLDAQILYELGDGLSFMKDIDLQPEVSLQPCHLCKIVGTPRHLMHIKWDLKAFHNIVHTTYY